MTELALVREAGYRLLAALFLYPDCHRRTRLRRAARSFRDAQELRGLAFARAWAPLLDRLSRDLQEGVEAEYVRLFGPDGSGPACPLWESAYGEGPGTELYGSLNRAYVEVGLVPAGPEPPDHLSVQLEYLSALVRREAEAWQQDVREAAKVLQAEHRFLVDHPWRWAPELVRRLQRHGPGGLYGSAAAALEAFLEHEVDLTGLLVERAAAEVAG